MKIKLGDLAAIGEGGNPADAHNDAKNDSGGWSYGAFQFAQSGDIPAKFVEWLNKNGNAYGVELSKFETYSNEFIVADPCQGTRFD